jgi:hypothetical protein
MTRPCGILWALERVRAVWRRPRYRRAEPGLPVWGTPCKCACLADLQDYTSKSVKQICGGAGATYMQNDKGVVINLTGVGQGVDFRLAVSGMDVTRVK